MALSITAAVSHAARRGTLGGRSCSWRSQATKQHPKTLSLLQLTSTDMRLNGVCNTVGLKIE